MTKTESGCPDESSVNAIHDGNELPQGTMIAMDTSTATLTTALFRNGELLVELNSDAERNHSLYIVTNIKQMLQSQGMKPEDVDALSVGQGPGSYTGIRIGASVAKTFAWAKQIPLLAVSSLKALALGGLREAGAADRGMRQWIVPLVDARRGQAFTALYEADGAGLATRTDDMIRVVAPWTDELLELARQAGDAPLRIVFAGETELHRETLERFASEWPDTAIVPVAVRACDIGRIAYERWRDGQFADVHGFVPNYTQLPEAEVKLKAAKKA